MWTYWGGDLLRTNIEKVQVLNAFFVSFFTGKTGFQEFQAPKTSKEVWSEEDLPSVKEDKIRECLNQMGIYNR